MPVVEIVGYIAAMLSVICFIPQAIKILLTKDTNAISFWMYFLFLLSVIFWLIYGLMLGSLPIIFAGIILGLKIKDLMRKK